AHHKRTVELHGRDHEQWDRIESDHLRDALALEYGFRTLRITWRRLRQAAALAPPMRVILAHEANHQPPGPMLSAIDHVGVAVPSIEAALPLYRDAFEMELVHRETIEEQGVHAAL